MAPRGREWRPSVKEVPNKPHHRRTQMRRTPLAGLIATFVVGSVLVLPQAVSASPVIPVERRVEPVILTGAQLAEWSRLPAEGTADPHNPTSKVRDAHNGELVVPPDARTGAPVDQIAAYSFSDGKWNEVPVQVDERFPYFLANYRSSFGVYSGTDKELTYEWDIESWKKTAGECEARYPATDDTRLKGFPTEDPVRTLDDDDEVVVMASDAGGQAPAATVGPPGTTGGKRYEIRLNDPLDPTASRFVYLFLQNDGSSFDETNGYVSYERDANADQWVDRNSWARTDPEKLGTSNENYGPNLPGTVCDPDGTVRQSTDRFPRDGVTVTTDSYKWYASGRWMVREMHVAKPGEPGVYGPDLIDRWKGRAFQSSPASQISLVGFEDEQVNWEANSALLGERMGPVRAIRETWGADSGTNTTKTEFFYRDSIAYRYRVRVHPIPPDGLYTSWDYNHDKVSTYYNELLTQDDAARPGGVPVDGVNDDIGNIDSLGAGPMTFPAFFDATDPTFAKPLAMYNWEQVSGKDDNGSLVYMFEIKNAQALENPAVIPFYRDDACFDDGTGDDPSPHPHPGDPYTTEEQERIPCYTEAPAGYDGPYRQGAFGSHGVHYLYANDTDNSFSPERTTEIDGQQWQWAAPTESPRPVGDEYAQTVKTPLLPVAVLQNSTAGRYETEVTQTGATSGQTSDQVTLEAALSSQGRPVAGKELLFEIDNKEVGRAVTGSDGKAALTLTLSGPARETSGRVTFAGDDAYTSDEVAYPFEVLRDDSTMSLRLHGRGPVTAVATLSDSDSGVGVGSKSVRFLVGGTHLATAQTNDQGVATVTIPKKQAKAGVPVRAIFDTDDFYNGSAAESTISKGS